MNQTLYQIAEKYQQDMITLQDMDLPEEAINDTLEGMSGELVEKGKSVAAFFQNIDSEVAQMEEYKKRIDTRIRAYKARSDRLKKYLLDNMVKCEITAITCPEFEIKTAKTPPSVVIDEGAKVPEKYQVTKTTVSPDKNGLREALKNGEEFEGIRLVSGHRLSIK